MQGGGRQCSWLAEDVRTGHERRLTGLSLADPALARLASGWKGSAWRARWPLHQHPHLPGWQHVHECATGTCLTPVRWMASGPSTGTATSRGTTRIRPM